MNRLLFDQNLSPRLVAKLSDLYPESVHTDHLGLGTDTDERIWTFALDEGYIIVTKDADFSELSILRGTPPKVIWIRRGNCSTKVIESLLRQKYEAIAAFSDDSELGILTLF